MHGSKMLCKKLTVLFMPNIRTIRYRETSNILVIPCIICIRVQPYSCSRHSHNQFAIQSCASCSCLFTITVGGSQLPNPILRRRSPENRLHQMLAQLPETSRLSYRASCRRGTGECRYHLAFSVAIREGRGGRSSHRLELDRRNNGGRNVAGSVWGALESVKATCADADGF